MLLLISEDWNLAPPCFHEFGLEALIAMGLLKYEDRADGRYYALTEEGLFGRESLNVLLAEEFEG